MKRSVHIGVLLFGCIAFACDAKPDRKRGPTANVSVNDARGEPQSIAIIDVELDDATMKQAMVDARTHLHVFEAALKRAEPGMLFAVKKPFPHELGHEHMWLSDVRAVQDGFEGRLDNTPRDAKGAQRGHRYVVRRTEVSDWNYIDGEGRMWGNYTARVLLPEMTEEQRKPLEAILQPLP